MRETNSAHCQKGMNEPGLDIDGVQGSGAARISRRGPWPEQTWNKRSADVSEFGSFSTESSSPALGPGTWALGQPTPDSDRRVGKRHEMGRDRDTRLILLCSASVLFTGSTKRNMFVFAFVFPIVEQQRQQKYTQAHVPNPLSPMRGWPVEVSGPEAPNRTSLPRRAEFPRLP